jgi:hypothetical protein
MYQVPRTRLGFVPGRHPFLRSLANLTAPILLTKLIGRATFVIDSRGHIRDYFSSVMNHRGHIENAIQILDGLYDEEYQK